MLAKMPSLVAIDIYEEGVSAVKICPPTVVLLFDAQYIRWLSSEVETPL